MTRVAVPSAPLPSPVPGTVLILNVLSVCDARCGAQAYVLVTSPSGKILFFCKHDFESRELALLASGFTVTEDNRHDLCDDRQKGDKG